MDLSDCEPGDWIYYDPEDFEKFNAKKRKCA